MAAPTNTYMAIPPPPLPEFYLPKNTPKDVASSTSSSDDELRAEIAIKRASRPASAIPGDGTDERWTSRKTDTRMVTVKIPPPPPRAENEVSSLAVYHICRICLRPRSARYHRDHPIPVDGVPPPPGICRRCRVTSAEDQKTATTVIEKHESDNVKLGVRCLVPDDDCFTNDEMRSKRANYITGHAEWREVEPPIRQSREKESFKQQEVVYRHVHVTVPPPPPPQSPPKSRVVSSSVYEVIEATSNDAERSSRARAAAKDVKHKDQAEVISVSASSHASASAKSKRASSSSRASVSVKTSRQTESEIRRLARDEVERYRQAERKLDAHQDPYAHGHLVPVDRVPVERRIELERDIPEKKPWERQSEPTSELALAGRRRDEKGEETLVVEWSHKRRESDQLRPGKASVQSVSSSSTSSDKTRWPRENAKRLQQDTIYQRDESASAKDLRQARRRDIPAVRAPVTGTKSRSEYDVVEVVERWEYPPETRGPPTKEVEWHVKPTSKDTYDQGLRNGTSVYEDVVMDGKGSPGRSSKWSEREYRRDDTLQSRDNTKQAPTTSRLAEPVLRQQHLPYPRDETSTPVSMPSPRSHLSSVKETLSHDHDREYYLVQRTVKPASKPSGTRPRDETDKYYKETQEYLHRRRVPRDSAAPEEETVPRSSVMKRRPSDTSSRVRFASKVEVSPTPPGSDASSSQFRNFGGTKPQLDGQDPERDLGPVAEYEHRGRSRSREPSRQYGYYYERDTARIREREFVPVDDEDRDRTPRPIKRRPQQSNISETNTHASTVPVNVKEFARAKSESPSREELFRAAARKQREDGLGPYTVEERRSASVDVEDGSTVDSEDGSDRERRKRHDHSRRRGKRL